MKKMFFVVFIVGFMALVQTSGARAAAVATTTPTTPSSGDDSACGVTSGDLAVIKAIQNNPSLSYLSELQQELAARRNLLSKTILCAEAGAKQAKKDLNNAALDPSLESLRGQWSDRLDSAVSYYDLQLQKVNEVGINGTESIAKEVLAWRGTNYAPLAENVSNFVLWSGNQALFTMAASRLSQIGNLAGSPLFSESLAVQSDYEQAAVSLKTAEDQNASAKNAFSQSLSPDQTFFFIKQSLDSLSSTYQQFFDISNLIQSLLPH